MSHLRQSLIVASESLTTHLLTYATLMTFEYNPQSAGRPAGGTEALLRVGIC